MSSTEEIRLAGIEYHGLSGITKACTAAVVHLLQVGISINSARILSHNGDHGLLLSVGVGDLVAIKSGFASGYGGEGPSGFSYTLQLLDDHGVEISEVEVTPCLLERLDASGLTNEDLATIERSPPARGRWTDYIFERDWVRSDQGRMWRDFPHVIPFAVIDPRLSRFAIDFWANPDSAIVSAYRLLEDTVRDRARSDEHGARLFSQVFTGGSPALVWEGVDAAERGARAQLFSATYTAFRNSRAHRQPNQNESNDLLEFLLINQLFVLEAAAVIGESAATPT